MTAAGDGRDAARALRLAADDRAAWSELATLGDDDAAAVVRALKELVDERVRQNPPEAVPIAAALVRASERTPALRALALRGRAVAAHFVGDHAASRADLVVAARLHAEAGEALEAAIAERSLIEVCHQLGRGDEALEWADRARAALEQLGADERLAELEVNVGNVHTRLDEYARAAAHYRQARALFERCGNALGLSYVDFNLAVVAMNSGHLDEAERAWRDARAGMAAAGHRVHVADCDYSLAYLEFRRERFHATLEGLAAAREAYDANGKPSGVPMCDLDLAEVYLALDARRDALEHASRAAEAFGALGLEVERAHAEKLGGRALLALGDEDGALEVLGSAGDRFARQGHRVGGIAVELERAAVELSLGRPREADDRLAAALAQLAPDDAPALATTCVLRRAEVALAVGRTDEVLALAGPLAEGRRVAGALPLLFAQEAAQLVGHAHLAAGDRRAAIAAFRRAVARTDAAWLRVPTRELRTAFFRGAHAAFRELALLLADEPATAADALVTLEAGRVRSDARDPDLEGRSFVLGALLDAHLDGAERERPFRPVAEVGAVPGTRQSAPALADLTAGWLDAETVAVEFVARGADVRALVVVAGDDGRPTVEALRLPTDLDALAGLRERLLFHLGRVGFAATAAARRAVDRALDAGLRELGERVIAPLVSRLEGRRVLFVPYGPLHDVPLHAAIVDGRSLASRCDVGYALSLRHLARVNRPPIADGRWLVAGAAAPELAAVARELAALEGARGAPLEPLAREALAGGVLRAELVHVSAHGQYAPRNPRLSSIGVGDGELWAEDVARATLDLDLVTLSGCDTGRLARLEGEDFVGLVQAFLQAGARAVVASGWPVEDAAAADFMAAFYAEATAGSDLVPAVSRTWRMLEDDGRPPGVWAAFSATGAPDVRLSRSSPAARP